MAQVDSVKDTHYVLAEDLGFVLRLYILDHEFKYPHGANINAPSISGQKCIVEHSGLSQNVIARICDGRVEKVTLNRADHLLCSIHRHEALYNEVPVYEEMEAASK